MVDGTRAKWNTRQVQGHWAGKSKADLENETGSGDDRTLRRAERRNRHPVGRELKARTELRADLGLDPENRSV